ncbi:hypothetical protein BDB13_6050 [Rhodococcus sp. OK302]|nr:hypothetical protein BDB13_6050 [Rhodococcus sp. OK302]
MSRHRAHNPTARWSMCERCNHRGYYHPRRRESSQKRHHGVKGMAVFACPHTDGMFHIGHRPAALSAGIIDRAVLREQAQHIDNHPNHLSTEPDSLMTRHIKAHNDRPPHQ